MAKVASGVDQISYGDLYTRWEHSNWRSTDLDFSQDHTDWHETFTEHERRAALWNYSMFFHGEDSVTDNLSPYIDAAPLEEQKYFLATQQVDEARHAVFFGRFMSEVVERGETQAGSLAATRPELTWGFRKTFAHLDKVADGLRRDRSKPNLAAAITMYHLIVEATLAVPGQEFIERYVTERKILPAFGKGMRNISKDEQRHIGFGVKILADLNREDPEVKHAVADLIREVMPFAGAVFVPPNWDRSYVECFGSSVEEVYATGGASLEQKLKAAGLPLEELPGPPPLPINLTPMERAEHALTLLQAGVLGEKTGPPSKDPEVVAVLFDLLERSVDASASPNGPTTIQWDFKDAEPWHMRIANGSTRAEKGRLEDADLTLRCRFEDWTDIIAGHEDPRFAIAKGKLRPKGSVRTLMRMRKLFGR